MSAGAPASSLGLASDRVASAADAPGVAASPSVDTSPNVVDEGGALLFAAAAAAAYIASVVSEGAVGPSQCGSVDAQPRG